MARISSVFATVLLVTSSLAQAADKWVYGELSSSPPRGGGANSANLPLLWITGERIVTGTDWKGMEEKLGKNAEADKAELEVDKDAPKEQIEALTKRIQQKRVLNQLGNEGWELVSFSRSDFGQSTWIFKRRIDDSAKK